MDDASSPSAANHPAQDWADDWHGVRSMLEGNLKGRFPKMDQQRYIYNILAGYKQIIPYFPTAPREITPAHITQLARWSSGRRNTRVALSHLCLMLIRGGIWPKEYLLRDTTPISIEKYLVPEWRKSLGGFRPYLYRLGVSRHVAALWFKWISMFVWWADFPEDAPLESGLVRKAGTEFWQFLLRMKRDDGWNQRNYGRAFSAFWNFLIEQKRLVGEQVVVERVVTTFWGKLQEPLRVRLHSVHPTVHRIVHNNFGPDATRLRVLKYALWLLKFSVYHPSRSLVVSRAEIERLKTTLRQENFCDATVASVLEEIGKVTTQEEELLED